MVDVVTAPLCPNCGAELPEVRTESRVTCRACGRKFDGAVLFDPVIDEMTPDLERRLAGLPIEKAVAVLQQENARLHEVLDDLRATSLDHANEIAHLRKAINAALDGLEKLPHTAEKRDIASALIQAILVR